MKFYRSQFRFGKDRLYMHENKKISQVKMASVAESIILFRR